MCLYNFAAVRPAGVGYDVASATVQLADTSDLSDIHFAPDPRNYDHGWRSRAPC